MEIKYFIANKKYFERLAELRYEFKYINTNYDYKFIKAYKNYLYNESKLDRIKVFCVAVNKIIIGNINLIIIPKSPKSKSIRFIGWITNSYIKEQYRNMGLGSELIRRIKEYAKIKMIETLFVWPSEKSVKFYTNLDFKEENEILECEILEYQ